MKHRERDIEWLHWPFQTENHSEFEKNDFSNVRVTKKVEKITDAHVIIAFVVSCISKKSERISVIQVVQQTKANYQTRNEAKTNAQYCADSFYF